MTKPLARFKAQRLGSEMEKALKENLIVTFLGAISQAPHDTIKYRKRNDCERTVAAKKEVLFYNWRGELKERRYGRNSLRCDGRE
jgi:hypothetical protein